MNENDGGQGIALCVCNQIKDLAVARSLLSVLIILLVFGDC
jgi:hypothetical protein